MIAAGWIVCTPLTFNHGVEGSSPSALTNEIKYLAENLRSSIIHSVGAVLANRLRRGRSNTAPCLSVPPSPAVFDMGKTLAHAAAAVLEEGSLE